MREHALFDVRETGEAHRGHLPGASVLPRRQIELRLADLAPRRDTPITVYDSGEPADRRALRAAATLGRLGWTNAEVLKGGVQAWIASGGRLAHGSNVPSKRFGEELKAAEGVPGLPVEGLKRWQDKGRPHVVCDIRSPEEYAHSRIPGAFGAFGAELALLAGDLRERGVPIVVHCSGRTRSIIACRSLQLLGVPDVYALENGTMGWQLAGFQLERGPGAGALQPGMTSRSEGERDARRLALTAGAQLIDAKTLAAWLRERTAGRANVYAIDVRQVSQYIEGHAEGSIAVPGGLAIQRADEFIPLRDARIVFIDDREARAALVAYWYRRMGFAEVYVLHGGLAAWVNEAYALARGRGRAQPLGWAEARAFAQPINALELHALVAQGAAVIVSVDTSAQYAKARPAGTAWIRYGDVEDRVAAMTGAQRRRLVLACRDGILSTLAAANLARESLEGVRVLADGVAAWQASGLPIERGAPAEAADDLVVQPYDAGPEAMRRYLEWEQALTVCHAEAGK